MIDLKTPVIVRPFDAASDTQSLRECLIDQQNYHRGIEPSWPDGDAIVKDYMAYLEAECAIRNGRIFMALCGEEALGFACVLATTRGESPDDPMPFAWIHDVYVKPEHRRRGVASMLMAEAERFAHGEGAQCLRLGILDSNENARRFYVRHGFRDYTHILTKRLE
jgi:GNAT superfamily N-acetyltransferase